MFFESNKTKHKGSPVNVELTEDQFIMAEGRESIYQDLVEEYRLETVILLLDSPCTYSSSKCSPTVIFL